MNEDSNAKLDGLFQEYRAAVPDAEPGTLTATGVIDTYASAGRLPEPKVSAALPSGDVTVPPSLAMINTDPAGGGPRPLPGIASGSPAC